MNAKALAQVAGKIRTHRISIPLLLVGILFIAVGCSSSGASQVNEAGPLPPVAELATSEGLLSSAPAELRNCLSATFTEPELQANLLSYIESPFAQNPFQQCDPSGIDILSSVSGAVVSEFPDASAPFGLSRANFPDNASEILALYGRAEFRGPGIANGNEMQAEVRFIDGESDAISIEAEFSGLPEGTSPTVMIGTMLVFVGTAALPESRVGGTDGDLTWLRFVPPQTPDGHALLWARNDAKWAFTATASSEVDLEELIESLVEAIERG